MLIRRSHELRYTLKNTETDEVYFVVVFTLLLREDVEKEEAESKAGKAKDAPTKLDDVKKDDFKPSEDDLD